MIAGFKDIRLFAHDDSADRNAACQTLSHRDDVGFDFSPLMSEPLAGATHAALDFVAHHQEVVFVTDFTNAFDDGKIDRDDAAFAENRFKEDSDNIFISSTILRIPFKSDSSTKMKPSVYGEKSSLTEGLPVAERVAMERPWKACF